MRYLPRALLAGGTGFAVSCLAACGGGAGLLSGSQSAALQSELSRVAQAVSSHRCPAASYRAAELSNQVNRLPNTVNVTLRQDLQHGVATVSQLASQDCATNTTPSNTSSTSSSTSTSTSTTSTTPTTSSSRTTTSTPTTGTTTSTTTSTATSTTPTTPTTSTTPSGGGGLGGGGANGQASDSGSSPRARGAGRHA